MAVWLLGSTIARAADLKVVWDESTADAYRRAVLIPEADFRFSALEPLLRKTLEENRDKRFVQLQLSPEEQQLNPYPRFSELRFDGWLYDYRALARVHWRLAELISFDGKAVLRIRDGDTVSKVVLRGGADPLLRRVGGTDFEIMYVYFRRRFQVTGNHVFAKSQTATASDVRLLLQELQVVLPPPVTSVSVGKDGLFPVDDRAQFYYLFDIRPEPTRAEWESSVSTTCADYGRGIECY